MDISDYGKIVGASNSGARLTTSCHLVLFSHGTPRDLGALANLEDNCAEVINNAGRIAGYSNTNQGMHAFIYEHGVLTDVGNFGAFPSMWAILPYKERGAGTGRRVAARPWIACHGRHKARRAARALRA